MQVMSTETRYGEDRTRTAWFRKAVLTLGAVVTTLLLALAGLPAHAQIETGTPDRIPLPNGFQPEGIAIGPGPFAFFGSRATGEIFRADLRTGRGRIISGATGSPSLGLKTDRHGRLFVAGGTGGDARVIDTRTGKVIASYRLASGPAFINDVVLTRWGAFFTDSTNPVLYLLPFRDGKRLPKRAIRLPLRGDVRFGEGINANGITVSPDRKSLLIVQSNTGKLFRVNPSNGVTRQVRLGGKRLENGDGLLLIGNKLIVVQNRQNLVVVVALNRNGSAGRIAARITSRRLDVPTTVATFQGRLYLPNARFTTEATPDTEYDAVAIRLR
jgi:hypothetical protein